ncbi:fimbrillin family protein [Bacteroides sp. 519]|uniref:fimbrillin family protein n=1 Tax=Bacteroides sp. 519 TaxID=2302937 RepID=UPI0013D87F8A|nr:fimbrillin family protein [Bacteroides sp. 519]NDV59143.1 hypothetical protein [Bacteroides sp. 519]
MRKLLVFATAAVFILGSCSNEDELAKTGTDNGSAIEFRTMMDKGANRAAVTDPGNILSFTVTGKWSEATGAHDMYLFNAFGITRGEGADWAYTPKRYLPSEGTVDFYAYSPASSKNVTPGKGIKDYANPNKLIEYTVPTIKENDAQEDFLIAKRIGIGNSKTGNTTVKLNFHHALSRVKFHARKTKKDITYVVGKVALVNLKPTGTLDLTSAYITEDGAIDHTSTAASWTATGTEINYEVDMGKSPIYLTFNDNKPATADDYSSLLGATNDILVMPQPTTLLASTAPTAAKEFAVYIEYKAYKGGTYYAGDTDRWEEVYFPVSGDVGAGIEFKMERQYNFFLTFGDEVGGPISFEVNVTGWDDPVIDGNSKD